MRNLSSKCSFTSKIKRNHVDEDIRGNTAFTISNNILLLSRIKYTSIILPFLFVYFFYSDLLLFKDVPENNFPFILAGIHLNGFILSIVFLFIHNIFRSEKVQHSIWITITIYIYIFSYIMGGALASINSQQLNGNIYAYIIILIGVAAFFPIRPKHFFFILLCTHIIFLIGISHFNDNAEYDFISKQINSTGTAVIAFIINSALYIYRKKDFHNQLVIQNGEQNLHHLFNVNPYPLILISLEDGKIILANDKALDFYSVKKEELDSFDAVLLYSSEEERASIMKQLKTEGFLDNYLVEQKTAVGSKKWVLVNYKLIDYMHSECVLMGVTDITDLKKIEAELEMYATTDMLTGVLNRRKGMEILHNIILKSKIEKAQFVLLFIDINNLKQVNDHYGHPEGDYLVKTVCTIIKSRLDIQDIIFRYGGDEFIIAFMDKHTNHAEKIWTEIVELLKEENAKKWKPYTISVSHGLFYYDSTENISLQEIIDYADREMYKEKALIKSNNPYESSL
ncbi:diguanylate cyclase [Bacillus sp. FJAT-49736]|uniref:sensor domain-containing diguanylate cyclase n=1 Tax=Bacillus sp. FJAT-49736 TaxID=2833582 RepID=UPI001BCA4037|nr:diguanylate cyclase [Bacillus sp. FJAT-49736]MBS4175318.1 diguanylate cyclase [Bacillus sp. FJAT-49736]